MKFVISDALARSQEFTHVAVSLSPDVISHRGFASDHDGLSLWRHEFQSGGRLGVARPAEDHAFYVLSGSIRVGEQSVGEGGALCVARNASATAEAGPSGAALLHYIGHEQTRPAKAGGCVHVLSPKGIHATVQTIDAYEVTRTIYADSMCPTCSVWLHKSCDQPERFYTPHTHSTDEVISVLDGSLLLGARALEKGAAVAIPASAYYSFTTGPRGLTFLNFRQDEPMTLRKGAEGATWVSDRESMMSRASRPGVRVL